MASSAHTRRLIKPYACPAMPVATGRPGGLSDLPHLRHSPSPAYPTSIEALTVMPNAGMAGASISAPPCCVRMDASTLRMACCSADGADADAAGGRAGCLAQLRDEVGGRGGDQAGCGGRNIGSGSHSPVAVVDDDGAGPRTQSCGCGQAYGGERVTGQQQRGWRDRDHDIAVVVHPVKVAVPPAHIPVPIQLPDRAVENGVRRWAGLRGRRRRGSTVARRPQCVLSRLEDPTA